MNSVLVAAVMWITSVSNVFCPTSDMLELRDGGLNRMKLSLLIWVGEYEAKSGHVGFAKNIIIKNNAVNKHRWNSAFFGPTEFAHTLIHISYYGVDLRSRARRDIWDEVFPFNPSNRLNRGGFIASPDMRFAEIGNINSRSGSGILKVNTDLGGFISLIGRRNNSLGSGDIGSNLLLSDVTRFAQRSFENDDSPYACDKRKNGKRRHNPLCDGISRPSIIDEKTDMIVGWSVVFGAIGLLIIGMLMMKVVIGPLPK